jgi:putative PIN family toxin of toxin-antitoxin system
MKKIVIDTNISISAFFWNGLQRKVYELARNKKVILLYSSDIERELIRVLSYKKFKLNANEILPLAIDYRNIGLFVKVISSLDIIKEDPTDNIFLECAVDGDAEYIISGDAHLLNLKKYKNIDIVNAKEFLVREKYF